jgi:hypothetical protein
LASEISAGSASEISAGSASSTASGVASPIERRETRSASASSGRSAS